jgi:transposase
LGVSFWKEIRIAFSETQVRKVKPQEKAYSMADGGGSAVNSKGAFWYSTYQGGLNEQLFIQLLQQMMRNHTKPVHLVVDGLPAHKTKLVNKYVTSTEGRLTIHVLPGYAPELNPDELVWSHVKRTGVSRTPLRKGEKLSEKIEMQLAAIKKLPSLVRAFFKPPSVAYITD